MLDPDELISSLKRTRAILDALRAELNTVIEQVALLPAPARTRPLCPHCGISKSSTALLDDHMVNVHGLEAPVAA